MILDEMKKTPFEATIAGLSWRGSLSAATTSRFGPAAPARRGRAVEARSAAPAPITPRREISMSIGASILAAANARTLAPAARRRKGGRRPASGRPRGAPTSARASARRSRATHNPAPTAASRGATGSDSTSAPTGVPRPRYPAVAQPANEAARLLRPRRPRRRRRPEAIGVAAPDRRVPVDHRRQKARPIKRMATVARMRPPPGRGMPTPRPRPGDRD